MGDRLEVKVCVGSSCHVRGGPDTLKALVKMIERKGVAGLIDLKADLCLDNCLQAPNVVVGGVVHGGVTPDKVEKFFNEVILPKVRK